ncbi:MAG: CHAT domain-containing protein [Luteolibacter sp.]|uniref:CHAT domain-containing protein n=1 Tax=Luteolibacter sp. TaxID=1962973 RepID=UPI003263A621
MNLPVLTLQTIYFDDSDQEEARRLGMDLYERLTRPVRDPLAYGPGIPVLVAVSHTKVNPKLAETNVLIPVLGKDTFNLMKEEVLAKLKEWSNPGTLVLPVPISPNWRAVESKLPGQQLLTMLYGKGDPRRRTLDELILGTARIWEKDENRIRLFISHAKADLESTNEAARRIHDYVVTDGSANAFFDTNDLHPGESLESQVEEAVSHGVFIAVRGDAFSSRVWCQKELLHAKMNELPTLSVEVLRRGEIRSSPYGGNGPSLVWDGNPAPVVSMALVEWLRAQYFRKEADRVKEAAGLPEDVVTMARPPELLDFAQGPLLGEQSRLVLHPDPELSAIERRVLKSARPRLHLATPSTAFRRLLNRREGAADVSSPLEGMQVAMSLSKSPDSDGPLGYTSFHAEDATVQVARTLISCGAAIAYGGDFRPDGYTPLLAQLIQTYNQTASAEAQHLHSYLVATIPPGDAPENTPLIIHSLLKSPDMVKMALLPKPPATPAIPAALYLSDMRRVMAKQVQACFQLGGKTEPRTVANEEGYSGRYPGLVEEAWHSLQEKNPLYVAGGFGGAAALVADLLLGKKTPAALQDKTWMKDRVFKKAAGAIDRHPMRRKLGLPRKMEDLANEVTRLSRPFLKSDTTSRNWNGLSVAENKQLFSTKDPVTIAALVSKGLLFVARKKVAGKMQIELIQDSITSADKLDAVAIGTLEGVPLRGAGAALDEVTGGTATWAHSRSRSLVSLRESRIDADWLYLASLGKLEDAKSVLQGVTRAAADTAEQARQHGFQRLGIVSFGGNVLPETGAVASAMVKGMRNLPDGAVVLWYENDPDRYEQLAKVLGKNPKVKLTTRRSTIALDDAPGTPAPLYLTVELEGERLKTTFLPPSSSAVVSSIGNDLPQTDLERLSAGSAQSRRATPTLAALDSRGASLAKSVFGENAAAIFSTFSDSRLVIVHDAASARIPFEMLLAKTEPKSEEGSMRPALRGGITRLLSVSGLAFERQFAKPAKKGKLKVLLVLSNSKNDLPGAEDEANAVKAILSHYKDKLDLILLWNKDATVKKVAAALAEADVLHYCGHAFFDGPDKDQSGLILADNIFTGVDLANVDPLPRMAFVNACEGGRVRGKNMTKTGAAATAFAELFLHSGIDAYLGTFWEVGDVAAKSFACSVYTELAAGLTLELAVLASRKKLFDAKEPDWANYMLFGGSNFRLVTNR